MARNTVKSGQNSHGRGVITPMGRIPMKSCFFWKALPGRGWPLYQKLEVNLHHETGCPTSLICICLRSGTELSRLQTRHLNCISGFRAGIGMRRNVGVQVGGMTWLRGNNGMTGGGGWAALTQGQHHVHHSACGWAWQEGHRTFQQVVHHNRISSKQAFV